MKIASFNINNVKRRLTNLLSWLREAEPDIVCLQEIKAAEAEFPAEATALVCSLQAKAALAALLQPPKQ